MSKRTSFTELTGKTSPEPEKPVAPPASVLLHTITGNPDNPRNKPENDPEFIELVESFRQVGQLQPVTVVSRDVYLKHKQQHTEAIGDAAYVTLGGNRRLLAALELGWARIDVTVRDDLGDGDEDSLDEAVLIENIHRQNIAPLMEARFLKTMVDRYGSQGKVAKRIGKSQPYVSQRLSLLELDPVLQQAVATKELGVKEARAFNGMSAAEQRAAWEGKKSQPEKASAPATHNRVMGNALEHEPAPAPRAAAGAQPVKHQAASEEPAAEPAPVPTVPAVTEPTVEDGVSVPKQSAAPVSQPPVDPWKDAWAVLEGVTEWMDANERCRLLVCLVESNRDAEWIDAETRTRVRELLLDGDRADASSAH